MYQSFSDFIKDVKDSGKDWVVSQLKISGITFLLVLIGLLIVDSHFYPIAWKIFIPFIALFIAAVDAIPVLGISAVMLPWAAIVALFGEQRKAGLAIFIVYLVVMVIKQISEPFIRSKSLGVSPIEEIIASLVGYLILGGAGFIVGPLLYTIGSKVYQKFNPDSLFTNMHEPGYFADKFSGKSNSNDITDITDEVEDVEE